MRCFVLMAVLAALDCQAGADGTGTESDAMRPETTPPATGVDVHAYDPPGFCRPAAASTASCPDDQICCSDDPATVHGLLPTYFFNSGEQFGTPIFSDENNDLSHSGRCLLPGASSPALTNGCPAACDPNRAGDDSCSQGQTCCPFQAVDPDKDCVVDPETGRWRAVQASDVPTHSRWGDQHTTNQDPDGTSCMKFATVEGHLDAAVLADCLAQRAVASHHGFCAPALSCGCHEDLCAQKNADWQPSCDPI